MRMLGAGKPGMDLDVANIVSEKYGFSFDWVGSCVESQEFYDSLGNHNKKVNAVLSKEFGINWEKQFDIELDSMTSLINKAKQIVSTQTDYNILLEKFEENYCIIDLSIRPTKRDYIFCAQVYEYKSEDLKGQIYREWNIDTKNWKVLK
jgi:hypothetical protein